MTPRPPSATPRAGRDLALRARSLLVVVLGDGLGDGAGHLANEELVVGRRPVARGDQRGGRVLELRHDLAREELVGAKRVLAVRPVVGHDEVAAEAAGLLLEPLDL